MSNNAIKIVECPREAWQSMARQIPTETKVDYLRALVVAGCKQVDAVSFVSPRAVPQMADSEDVLKRLDPPDDVEVLGLATIVKGVERAVATEAVRTLVFPYALSETFLKQQFSQSAEENSEALEAVWQKTEESGLGLTVNIAMAFGNPFGDAWSVDETMAAVENISDMGIKTVTLVESTGTATSETIGEVLEAVVREFDRMEIGVCLHTPRTESEAKLLAAYDAGCRRFSSVTGGLGGAVDTQTVLTTLTAHGALAPIHKPLTDVLRLSEEIAARFGAH